MRFSGKRYSQYNTSNIVKDAYIFCDITKSVIDRYLLVNKKRHYLLKATPLFCTFVSVNQYRKGLGEYTIINCLVFRTKKHIFICVASMTCIMPRVGRLWLL